MLSDLYEIAHDHIPEKVRVKLNKSKSWEYGYNDEFDVIVISKDGTIGEVYMMNGLYIGLPSVPTDKKLIDSRHNRWIPDKLPVEISKIRNLADWKSRDQSFKSVWTPYLDQEFDRRENGHWFINNGKRTYITGSHYMYMQWSMIDVGLPEFRESNRLFWIYWAACVADYRCYGMCYVKNRRSGFSFMGASESNNIGTINKNARLGILSKTGDDAKKLFTDKVVPIVRKYPFFFKPIQDGNDNPKTELAFRIPATRLTKKSMDKISDEEELEGLDSSIDWKATENNSYDGEKLLFLLSDESGKWEKPQNIINNWKVVKTCLRLGSKIKGKCMMGSTVNALAKGGANFKKIFYDSDPRQRHPGTKQTKSGLYGLFIPMEDNYEGHIDQYGMPVYHDTDKVVLDSRGDRIRLGSIDWWKNECDAFKGDPEGLNEHYRQFPRTLSHAFRDESKESIFDVEKIHTQIDYNDTLRDKGITVGNFSWRDGVRFSKVVFTPAANGRFSLSWIPPLNLQNNVLEKNGKYYPQNGDLGAFGNDPYDITGVVGGGGSKGALSGLTGFSMNPDVPSNFFFLEYASRISAEIFFEDVLMACWFYGMPILIENNKSRILYHFKNANCRPFSLNRPDKHFDKLSATEKELGGIPSQSEDILQAHAAGIDTYINKNVGYDTAGTYRDPSDAGCMYFNKTLDDWLKFDIRDRGKYDLAISSGYAIMAVNRHTFILKSEKKPINIPFTRFDNSGSISKRIE